MYRDAIRNAQYWRLVAAGFLHADPLHLVLNMICLVSWAGILERRVGPFHFVAIYLCSLIGGSAASVLGHPMIYLSVGASGALSGLVGALLGLFILDKIRLSGQFFIGVIGLNVVLMASVARIDWWNHLGGFAAGLISCALIDLVAKFNNFWLGCKFPEFVKFNVAISAAWLAMLGVGLEDGGFRLGGVWLVAMVAVITLVVVKLLDLLLSTTGGIAKAVLGFAAFYAAVPLLMQPSIVAAATGQCTSQQIAGFFLTGLCQWRALAPYLLSVLLLAVTLLMHRAEILRGFRDVGFVAANLRADRDRCEGI